MSGEFAPEGSSAADMADFSAAFGDVISSAPKAKETFTKRPDLDPEEEIEELDEEGNKIFEKQVEKTPEIDP